MNPNVQGALAALLAFGIYATHDVVVKFLGEHYHAIQIIFFSVLLGFPLVTVMLMRDRTDGNLRPRHPWLVLLRTAATPAVRPFSICATFSTGAFSRLSAPNIGLVAFRIADSPAGSVRAARPRNTASAT